jgi:hypothetical protein
MRKMYLWSCSSGGGVFCNGKTRKKQEKYTPPPEEQLQRKQSGRTPVYICQSPEVGKNKKL